MKGFWEKVKKGSGCWEWTAHKNSQGYGMFNYFGEIWLAHRVSAKINGMDVEDVCVLHHCDNPSCVNPKHLWLGTRGDNNKDRHKKGRSRGGRNIGEANPMSKLTAEEVRWIRQLGGSQYKIAKCFGITQSTVSRLKSRGSWAVET